MRHYFCQEIKSEHKEDILKKGLMNVFFSAYGSQSLTKIVSRLYKGFVTQKTISTLYIKERWEQEGLLSMTEEE